MEINQKKEEEKKLSEEKKDEKKDEKISEEELKKFEDELFGSIPKTDKEGVEKILKIDEKKKKLILELKERVKKWPNDVSTDYINKTFLEDPNDTNYFCYLDGYNWNVEEAEKVLKKSVEWRKTYKPQNIKLVEIKELMEQECVVEHGYCNDDCPIVYLKVGNDKLSNTDQKMKDLKFKSFVYVYTKCLSRLPKNSYQITWLIDLKNTSISVSLVKSLANMFVHLGDMHVERGHLFIVVNAPWYASALWAVAKLFITQKTIDKYRIHGWLGNPDAYRPILTKYIDENELIEEYGGKKKFKFDFEKLMDYDKKCLTPKEIEEKN